MKNSEPGRVLVSDAAYELVKGDIPCDLRGEISLKGIERNMMTYWVPDPAGNA